MKKIHRVLVLLLAALMVVGLMTTAFAEPTIDPSKKASLSIYKYDITKASNDGAWDAESYVSTGLHDDAVIDKLSKYAIQGVEFTYLRVADITMNNELVDGQRQVGVLYTRNTSYTTPDEKPIASPKTFDAGVALYGVSALLSLTGTALVIKRKNG